LVFSGTIEIANQEVEAEIILTESDDPLIGTGLLKDMVLNIDFSERKVEILPKS
jgi:predicted aspartyl protease